MQNYSNTEFNLKINFQIVFLIKPSTIKFSSMIITVN